MPTLFIVSAMVSGIGLLILLAAFRWTFMSKEKTDVERAQDRELILGLGKFLGGFILFDLFLVGNDILVLLTSGAEDLYVIHLMLFGKFAGLFVWTELLLGGVLPVILVFSRLGRRVWSVSLAAACTLVGVMAMRIVVVIAGQSVPLH